MILKGLWSILKGMDYKEWFSSNVEGWWKGRLSEVEASSAMERWKEEGERAKKASKLWKSRLAKMMDDSDLREDEVRLTIMKKRRQYHREWNSKTRIKFIETSMVRYEEVKRKYNEVEPQEPLLTQDDPFFLKDEVDYQLD